MHRGSLRWWIVVVGVPVVVVFGVYLPLFAFGTRYPDPIAVHWEFAGPPNGTMSVSFYLVFLAIGFGFTWVALILGSRRSMPSAPLTAVTYFVFGLLAAVNAQIVLANLDALSWEEAASTTVTAFVFVVAVGVISGGVGWFAAGGSAGVPVDEPLEMVVSSGVSWTGSASNGWLVAVGVAPLLLVPLVDPIWILLLLVIAMVAEAVSSVRVTADGEMVSIDVGPFGWPSQHISMSEISGAAAFDVTPMAYGGWGYRVRSGVRAYVIRGGPAIRIERSGGSDVMVTVDDAPVGAATIAAMSRR